MFKSIETYGLSGNEYTFNGSGMITIVRGQNQCYIEIDGNSASTYDSNTGSTNNVFIFGSTATIGVQYTYQSAYITVALFND